ncbi:hypothetical protein M885DRAFT_528116 [Pelagophyceae sp. CCMP2097]|nr:hypothetical protein M885DRAFT_528116 [Pelagophyceae sp. CCMP2097]
MQSVHALTVTVESPRALEAEAGLASGGRTSTSALDVSAAPAPASGGKKAGYSLKAMKALRVVKIMGKIGVGSPTFFQGPEPDDVFEAPADVNLKPYALWVERRVFHPDATPKVSWDCFVCLLILFSVITVTYGIGFSISDAHVSEAWNAVNIATDLLFGLDLLVACNTAYFDDKRILVHNRKDIFDRYSRGWLSVDFLSTFPFDRIGDSGMLRSLKLLKALRLARIAKIARMAKFAKILDACEESLGLNPAILKLSKPLVITAFAAHLLSCAFFFVGDNYHRCHQTSWLDDYCVWTPDADRYANLTDDGECFKPRARCDESRRLRHQPRLTQYITALYWAFATMTTVGYGDVRPSTDNAAGMVVVICCQVIGTMFFAYLTNIVLDIIKNMNPIGRQRTQAMQLLRLFLKDRGVHRGPLSDRILHNHAFDMSYNGSTNEEEIILALPPRLRAQCLVYVYRETLARVPLLCKLESKFPASLATLVPHLKPNAYLHGQVVNGPRINAREVAFVLEGRLLVMHKYTVTAGGRLALLPESSRLPDTLRGPRENVGAPTIVVPSDVHITLNVDVICITAKCNALVLHKHRYEQLASSYPTIFAFLKESISDAKEQAEWLHIPAHHRAKGNMS